MEWTMDFDAPIFQLDSNWIERIDYRPFVGNVFILPEGVVGFYVGDKHFHVFDTRDDLKSWVLKGIFERIDQIDNEIQKKREKRQEWQSYADRVAGA